MHRAPAARASLIPSMPLGPYPSFRFRHGASHRRKIGLSSTTIASFRRQWRIPMGKFIVEPHFRLQEWVAEEKGYFRDQGLDYEFRELIRSTGGKIHDKGDKVGAFQSFEEGRKSSVSCACHWTVNVR